MGRGLWVSRERVSGEEQQLSPGGHSREGGVFHVQEGPRLGSRVCHAEGAPRPFCVFLCVFEKFLNFLSASSPLRPWVSHNSPFWKVSARLTVEEKFKSFKRKTTPPQSTGQSDTPHPQPSFPFADFAESVSQYLKHFTRSGY